MAGRRAGANTPPAKSAAFAPPTRVARGVIVRERRRPATLGVAVAHTIPVDRSKFPSDSYASY